MRFVSPVLLAVLSMACGSSSDSNGSSDSSGDDTSIDATGDGSLDVTDASETFETSDGDSGTTAPPLWKSGTRLRVRLDTADGGARFFRGFHDKTLDVDCTFARDSKGLLRCLPLGERLVFTDATCTKPAVLKTKACAAAPKYGAVPTYDTPLPCEASRAHITRIYRAGAALPTASNYYVWVDGTGSRCESLPLDATRELLDASVEEDPTAFVAATATVVDHGAIALGVTTAADGASLVDRLLDAKSKKECTLLYKGFALLDEAWCSPNPTAYDFSLDPLYGDATCSKVIAAGVGEGCPVPSLAQVFHATSACPTTVTFRTVTKEVTDGYGKDPSTGVCSASSRPSRRFEMGGDFDLGTLAKLSGALLGTARLRAPAWAEGGEPVIAKGFGFQDTDYKQPCQSMTDAVGKVRCIPSESDGVAWVFRAPFSQQRFSDAACTKRIVLSPDVAGCTKPKPSVLVLAAEFYSTCGAPLKLTEVRAVGAKLTLTGTYLLDPDSSACMPQPVPAGTSAYDVGAVIASDSFPLVTNIVE